MSLARKRPGLLLRLCLAGLLWLPATGPATAAVEVRAGLEQNPPLSFIDEQGQAAGILVELLNQVATREGWQVVYVPDTFDRCLDKLKDGQIDLMVTIAYSKERAELFDFNRLNVIGIWGQLYAAQGSAIQSYFDLEGRRVAVMRKDIHHQAFRSLLEKFGVNVTYVPVDNFDAVFAAIHGGQADAGVVGRLFALRNDEAYRVQATPLIFNPIEVHYAVRKGQNGHLLAAIDRQLELFKADRDSPYYQSLERWLGVLSKRSVPRWLKLALLAGGTLLLLLFWFNILLRRQVKNRTRHLELEVAERSRAQKALLESELKYRELVENANAIILRWNPDGKVTFLNEFGEKFFGFGKDELVGQDVVGTIVPETDSDGDNLAEMIRQICSRPEASATNENENIRKGGERVWVSWRNRPVHDDEGQLTGILSVGLDITERKRAELALRAFDRTKDDFISTAAHELRTPLTSIIGYAELLHDADRLGGFSAEQIKDFLHEICAKGEALSRIVDDLLDISRIQQGVALPLEKSPGSISALVSRVVQHFERVNRRHRFRIAAADPLLQMEFDQHRITQVLENLLSNAVKYSPAESEIKVDISTGHGEVQVAVNDQGIGMTPEQASRVFEKFYRGNSADTAVGGLGLGMNIARQLVESHGGRIWVDSTLGVGTRVTFTLPC
jgi:PAS domain S-box-containing protein